MGGIEERRKNPIILPFESKSRTVILYGILLEICLEREFDFHVDEEYNRAINQVEEISVKFENTTWTELLKNSDMIKQNL